MFLPKLLSCLFLSIISELYNCFYLRFCTRVWVTNLHFSLKFENEIDKTNFEKLCHNNLTIDILFFTIKS